jgi:hypothetical protein
MDNVLANALTGFAGALPDDQQVAPDGLGMDGPMAPDFEIPPPTLPSPTDGHAPQGYSDDENGQPQDGPPEEEQSAGTREEEN